MCRVGSSVGQAHDRVWYNTATRGPFGSPQAVASLLELGVQQTGHALGNAGTQSSGLWQFIENDAICKHLHAGRAAESGLLAAELTALGVTGPPHIMCRRSLKGRSFRSGDSMDRVFALFEAGE